MIDLLSVYLCPNCGEILEDEKTRVTEIDTINDEVFDIDMCNKCNQEVRPKLWDDGKGHKLPYLQSVSHERWLFAVGFFDSDADYERLGEYLGGE